MKKFLVSSFLSLIFSTFCKYSSFVGSLPKIAQTAANSALPRYTFAPIPILLSKFLVEVEKIKDKKDEIYKYLNFNEIENFKL